MLQIQISTRTKRLQILKAGVLKHSGSLSGVAMPTPRRHHKSATQEQPTLYRAAVAGGPGRGYRPTGPSEPPDRWTLDSKLQGVQEFQPPPHSPPQPRGRPRRPSSPHGIHTKMGEHSNSQRKRTLANFQISGSGVPKEVGNGRKHKAPHWQYWAPVPQSGANTAWESMPTCWQKNKALANFKICVVCVSRGFTLLMTTGPSPRGINPTFRQCCEPQRPLHGT